MAFHDTPQVDRPSLNSERSEHELQRWFSQSANFLCRQDIPDKGCDFEIELITEGTNMSGWRFPLQLKSMERLQLVGSGAYVSYPFKTSRLGYLMRHQPVNGLIALYHVESGLIYFDYVYMIYQRLTELRKSDDWQQNDEVNIHIPVENVLNDKTITEIHRTLLHQFTQAARMQQSHGRKYGLPTTNLAGDQRYDWENVEDVKKMLKEYGIMLINQFDLHIVYELVCNLTYKDICSDFELLKVAAAIHCETGMFAEAELFNNRILNRPGLTEAERLIADYVKLRIEAGLGRIEYEEFIRQSKEIAERRSEKYDNLMLEINIICYELQEVTMFDKPAGTLLTRILEIFESIEQSERLTDVMKLTLKIWNAENYSIWINKTFLHELSTFRLAKALGRMPPTASRLGKIEQIHAREKSFVGLVGRLNQEVIEQDSLLLTAYLRSVIVRDYLTRQVNTFIVGLDLADDQKVLEFHIESALTAHQIFYGLSHFKDAYDALGEAIQLIGLSRNYYNYSDSRNLEELIEAKTKMELDHYFPEFTDVLAPLIRKAKNGEGQSKPGDFSFLKDYDDDQIQWFSKRIQQAMDLDDSCLEHIVTEAKSLQVFVNRCTRSDIHIFKVLHNNYSSPVRFILRSKISGVISPASADMNYLLEQWGM